MTQRDAHLEYYDVQRQFKEKTSVAELEAIFLCVVELEPKPWFRKRVKNIMVTE